MPDGFPQKWDNRCTNHKVKPFLCNLIEIAISTSNHTQTIQGDFEFHRE